MTRFRSQDEIDHYLGFVRFVVEHFKGRIRYYEIWSEENLIPPHAKWGGIRLEDYINLLEQVAPVIHAIDPEARVIAGSVGALWLPGYPNYGTFVRPYFDEKYLRGLVSSDVMPLIDGISMHIFYGLRPDDPFYRNYPRFVAEIKSLAYAHGFKGEFFSQEVTYRTGQEGFDMDLFPFPHVIAGKYLARVILIHRGLDIIVTVANDTSQFRAAFGRGKSSETSLALLNTLLDQAAPVSLPVEVKSDTDVEYLAHYAFRYPDERLLVGIWNDGLAVEEDPGITADLVFPGITAQRVQAYDLLYCLKQELHYENRLGGLVLPGIKLRDYPLLLEISPE